MSTSDGDFTVIFNGEIYNHGELRAELKAQGAIFQTDHSDTEVLLHGYRQWGTALPKRLNGMWAFALYDRKMPAFFAAAIDGKKPFLYSLAPKTCLRLLMTRSAASGTFENVCAERCENTCLRLHPSPTLHLRGGEKTPGRMFAHARYCHAQLPDRTLLGIGARTVRADTGESRGRMGCADSRTPRSRRPTPAHVRCAPRGFSQRRDRLIRRHRFRFPPPPPARSGLLESASTRTASKNPFTSGESPSLGTIITRRLSRSIRRTSHE